MLTTIARLILAVSRSDNLIAQSMRECSVDWVLDEHYATHKSKKIRVWVCNSDYGIHFEMNETPAGRYGDWKNKVTPGWAERRLIWREAKKLVEARKTAKKRALDRTIKATLEEALSA